MRLPHQFAVNLNSEDSNPLDWFPVEALDINLALYIPAPFPCKVDEVVLFWRELCSMLSCPLSAFFVYSLKPPSFLPLFLPT